nr:MAG TPA: tail sheath protein [Caudoviricetes sp.]
MADNKQVVRPGSYLKRERDIVQKATTVTPLVWGAIGSEDCPIGDSVVEVKSYKDFKDKFCMTDEQAKQSKLALAVNLWFLLNSSSMFVYNINPILVNTPNEAKCYGVMQDADSVTGLTVKAKYAGRWAESLKLEVTTDAVKVMYGDVTEVFEKKLESVNQSQFLTATYTGEGDPFAKLTAQVYTFKVTADAPELPIQDTAKQANIDKYLEKLMREDTITIATEYVYGEPKFIQNSAKKLEEELGIKVFPISSLEYVDVTHDLPTYDGYRGMVCTPYVTVMNPITGVIEEQPPTVAVPAIFGKLVTKYGIQQAPAGVEAILPNVTGVSYEYTEREQGILNASNINCIIPKKRYGVVLWGNRLINSDQDRDYVSDLLLDDYIDNWIKADTETFVFKNADDIMYSEITARITAFLRELWANGALAGETPNEAFAVRCDKELNADAKKGEVYAEVGWAKKYPAEFIYTTVKYMSV